MFWDITIIIDDREAPLRASLDRGGHVMPFVLGDNGPVNEEKEAVAVPRGLAGNRVLRRGRWQKASAV